MSELRLRLPGAVVWRRPHVEKSQPGRRGGPRYPEQYEQDRMAWGTAVRAQVHAAGWQATKGVPMDVAVEVVAAGRLDLDRCVTAVCDALTNGGAIADDCYLYRLEATRRHKAQGEGAMTYVTVREFAGALAAPERE